MKYESEIMNGCYFFYNKFKSELSKNLTANDKLSSEEIVILLTLFRLGGRAFVSEIIKEIGLSPSFVSKNTKKLENKGFIDIEVDKIDRRERILVLKKFNEELKEVEQKAEKEVLKNLDDSEREELKKLMIKAMDKMASKIGG